MRIKSKNQADQNKATELLVKYCSDPGVTGSSEYYPYLVELIEQGADVNQKSSISKCDILIIATYDYFQPSFTGGLWFIDFLLNNGADINTTDYFGDTPLYLAFIGFEDDPERALELIFFLLAKGAEIDLKCETSYNDALNIDLFEVAETVDKLFKPKLSNKAIQHLVSYLEEIDDIEEKIDFINFVDKRFKSLLNHKLKIIDESIVQLDEVIEIPNVDNFKYSDGSMLSGVTDNFV